MRRLPLLLPLAVALLSSQASASVPELFGFGARSTALLKTTTATVSGYESVYINPAGLAFEDRMSFSVGLALSKFDLDIGGVGADVESTPSALLGFAVPLPLQGPLERRLALGLGFVLPLGSILSADIPRPDTPRFIRYQGRTRTVSVMAALAVRILDELAIGGGAIALSELSGAIDVAPNETGSIGATVEDELRATYSVLAGASFLPDDRWSFGLAFRDESDARFQIPITADLGDQFPIPIPLLDVRGTAQFDPRTLTLGAAFEATDALLLSASVSYEGWSGFENPIVLTASAEGDAPQPEPEFSDVVTGAVGVEYRTMLDDFELLPRGALGIAPSGAPGQDGFHNYLDNLRLLFGAGIGVRAWGLSLSVSGQLQWLVARTSTKDRAKVSPLDQNPGYPTIEHDGLAFALVSDLGFEL